MPGSLAGSKRLPVSAGLPVPHGCPSAHRRAARAGIVTRRRLSQVRPLLAAIPPLLALTACTAVAGSPAANGPADPLAGLAATSFPDTASPALREVIATRVVQPSAAAMTVYLDTADPRAAVTVTVVTYPDSKGALILYNGYFAERAFHAAADRRRLPLGDEALGVELPWPPLHAVYARRGPRFVLAEASDQLAPPERRRAALEALAAQALDAEPGAPTPASVRRGEERP